MDPSSAALFRRIAGWLLLGCTLFGLILMHTLGHEDMTHHDHEHSTLADSRDDAWTPHADSMVGLPCEGESCHPLRVSGGSLPRQGSLWDICLAIVVGSLILLLFRAGLRGFVAGNATQSANSLCSPLPRPPPRSTHGLTITAMSVLRT